MDKKITQKDINNAVWKACDTFRGSIDPSVYKDYVLTMLFIKYLSDVHDDKYEAYLDKYNGEAERASRAMRHERFVVPEQSHFKFLYDSRNESNIGELINIALTDLEEANREKLYSEDGAGIFQNIDFNNSKLGEPKDKNTRLKNLLLDFNSEKLDLRPSHLDGNDIIGGAYEYLIANFASDAGKKAGEFFTPAEVSTLLAKLTKSKPGSRIADITCGSGSLLIKAGQEVGSPNFSLYGQEANGSTWALAVMNMFLHGIEDFEVMRGDTLRNPAFFEADGLQTFDCVIANPPFSLKEWGAENWGNDPFGRNIAGVPPKGNGDMAWVQHMVKSMNSTGRMTVVLPHGALFRKGAEGKIRKELLEQDMLEAVIGLGPNVFYGTQLAACVMVFKQNKEAKKKGKVLFVDASDQIRVGRAQNHLEPEHVQQIHQWANDYADVENYVKVATMDDLKENDFNLNIPLYVEKVIEDNLPSVEDAMTDLKQAWQESLEAEERFKTILKRFL